MMIRHISHTILLSILLFAGSAKAQNTHQDITVRYEETPTLRAVEKLALTPAVSLPEVRLSTLPYSSRQVKVNLPASITKLEPASYADSIYTSPYKGYAAIGFMPKYNLGLSAGYKILNNDKTRLNAWLQYDGTAYKGTPLQGDINSTDPHNPTLADKVYVRRNTFTLGSALHQAVGTESFIDAAVDYTFARYNIPVFESLANQNLHRFNTSILWSRSHNDLNFGFGAEYNHFGYTNNMGYSLIDNTTNPYIRLKPIRENHLGITGYVSGKFAGASSTGIDIALSHLSYNQTSTPCHYLSGTYGKADINHTLLTLTPHYRFAIDQFKLDLGLQLDFTFNGGKAFHIAPRITASWLPSDFVKMYIKASGGEWQNTAGSLYDVTPYALPFTAFYNSHIPLEAEVGVSIGPWRGFYAQIAANYAIANDWLMPVRLGNMFSSFEYIDMKGYKLHGAIGYNYRNIVDLRASFELAPQKHNRGYYLWRDRAKSVVAVDLRISPINPLDINIGWEYRGTRKMFMNYTSDQGITTTGIDHLGSINNLSAGAIYRIDSQWSAFIKGENLFNRHCLLIGGLPAQGITGLAGVTYKF